MRRTALALLTAGFLTLAAIDAPCSRGAVYHVHDGEGLAAALSATGANEDVRNTVVLSPGIYKRDRDDHLPGSFRYEVRESPRGSKSLTLTTEPGTGPESVVLDARGKGYVLRIHDFSGTRHGRSASATPEIVVENLTLQGGCHERGAAGLQIVAPAAAITVRNCVVRNNVSGLGEGGGIHLATGLEVLLEDCSILDNSLFEGNFFYPGPDGEVVHLTTCFGGGVHIASPLRAIVHNNLFARNHAYGLNCRGGGLSLEGSHEVSEPGNSTPFEVNGNTFDSNEAESGEGFFYSLKSESQLLLTDNIQRSTLAAEDSRGEKDGSRRALAAPATAHRTSGLRPSRG